MYKNASKLGVRFESSKGNLMVEDLWNLSLQQLNNLAKDLNRKLKETKEEDFLKETSDEDTILKLKFDIVIDILESKKLEKKEREDKESKKEEKQKLLEILDKKRNANLETLSEEEILKKLEEM